MVQPVLALDLVLAAHSAGFQLVGCSMTVLYQRLLECADLYRDVQVQVQVQVRVAVQMLVVAAVVFL
jgi:hypothetical protein